MAFFKVLRGWPVELGWVRATAVASEELWAAEGNGSHIIG